MTYGDARRLIYSVEKKRSNPPRKTVHMKQNTTCPPNATPPSGPAKLQGRIARGIETHLAGGLYARCHALWSTLHGGIVDFDDCVTHLATSLGHVGPIAWEQLDDARETIDNANLTWAQLRLQATQVFYTCYQNAAIEHDAYDQRTWQQVVYDTQYANGHCQACALGLPGTYLEHQELAGWVIHGLTSWQKLSDMVTAKQVLGNPNLLS